MYTSLFEEYLETESESVLEKAREVFEEDQQQRNKQLQEFIDDFIESPEYEEYVQSKLKILKTQAATQYSEDDYLQSTIVEEKNVPGAQKEYPLTEKTKKMFAFARHFERYIANEEKREFLNKQKKGIKLIRDKLDELKEAYLCNKDFIARKRKVELKNYVKEFCHAFDINLSHLSPHNRQVAENKIIRYKKTLHKKQIEKRRNITNIVRKIADELKKKKTVKKVRKTATGEDESDLSEIDAKTIDTEETSVQETEESVVLPPAPVKDVIQRKTVVVVNPKRSNSSTSIGVQSKVSKISKISKLSKSNNKNEPSPAKAKKETSKPAKPSKKEVADYILPNIPKSNIRTKINQTAVAKLTELFEEFRRFDDAMEDARLLKKYDQSKEGFDVAKYFICRPKSVVFDSYDCGKTYKKTVFITNKTNMVLKFVYKSMQFSSEYDKLCFEIIPLMDVIKLAPGCTTRFFVKFTPNDVDALIEGSMNFMTYNMNTLQPAMFSIVLQCVPKHTNLKIHLNHIDFGTIRYWDVKSVRPKALKLKNESSKPVFLVITKNSNPLGLPDDSYYRGTREKIVNIIEDIYQNVFSYVSLEKSLITLDAHESLDVKARLKNVEHVGSYFEKYSIDVYEVSKGGALVGSHEVLFTAEISGHVLNLKPDVVDFGVCFTNSAYQTGLYIHNSSSSSLAVFVKYPSQLTAYVKCDVSSICIPPDGTKRILLKFLPTPSVYHQSKYYNEFTSILEFPVYVFVSSRKFWNMPPGKVTAMAILAQPDRIQIRPKDDTYYQNGVLDLGKCTIYETVYADLEISNLTQAKQIYGFINLPEYATIQNFGFGELLPMEVKVLRLFFHPGYSDFTKFPPEQQFNEHRVDFTIKVETVASLGQLKTEMNRKNLRKSIDIMFKQLRTEIDSELYHDIETCKMAIRKEFYPISEPDENFENASDKSLYTETESKIDFTQLKCTATISRPLLRFSHQYIEFPPTPCGSYSFQEIELQAFGGSIGTACDANKRPTLKMMPEYEAFFRITGDNDDMKVEPSCGILKNGETKKILFVVKPSAPESILIDIASSLNKTDSNKSNESNLAKSKATNVPVSAKNYRKPVEKKLAQSEIRKLSRLYTTDYFPAEMFYWRNLDPYDIESLFVCEIRYNSDTLCQNFDRIFVRTTCHVIRPDFITNLKCQRIQFGTIAVGAFKIEHVIFQNIKYEDVEMKTSLLNPTGPFRVAYTKKLLLFPEHYLKLPIEFRPSVEGHFEEFFEVKSGRTTLPLILEGDAVTPDIDFSPDFLVCRMEASKHSHAECVIIITNKSLADIKLKFEKVCEIEGNVCISKMESDEKEKKQKTKKREITLECMSQELHEDELESITNQFQKISGPSNFYISGAEDGEICLAKGAPPVDIRICFGTQEALKKLEKSKVHIKKSGVDLSKKPFKLNETTKYNVAKFNVKLGDNFIRDFIFVCSKK